MNSLNLLSSRVIGQVTPPSPRRRSNSLSEARPSTPRDDIARGRSMTDFKRAFSGSDTAQPDTSEKQSTPTEESVAVFTDDNVNEKTALISQHNDSDAVINKSRWRQIIKRILAALAEGARIVLSYIGAPAVYLISCFQDFDGRYSPVAPVKRVARLVTGGESEKAGTRPRAVSKSSMKQPEKRPTKDQLRRLRSSGSRESLSAALSSDSEIDQRRRSEEDKKARRRSERISSTEESEPTRRSIRIKLNNSDSFQQRRKQRTAKAQSAASNVPPENAQLTVDNIKSPTSPSSHKLTKYPHAPAPPRPLIPRRQPSYTSSSMPQSRRASMIRMPHQQQKTLILDLDETLIHSLAKGGRMSSGHMVEVKLNAPVGVPGSGTLGPQHPILYYVHKRPHCDEFLRKVCKWYKLVIFTASVQEYADPVIDWLEQERKYFSGRYYRQHCTFRNGAYIKDLSSVEPDLSRVCILDNSPMSYIFHEGTFTPGIP